MAVTRVVIGVDVGGTNTDAVTIDRDGVELSVIAKAKVPTTADVTTGVSAAIHLALINSKKKNRTLAVQQINIGTTHFINAVVEGNKLANVAIIRLCGTASRVLPPFSDFPEQLADKIKGNVFLVSGGYQYDGNEISKVDREEIVQCINSMKIIGEKNVVVSGIFSPVRQDQEDEVVEIIKELYPEASVTASHNIGRLGLLERENAAILNECIKPLCLETIRGFRSALDELGLKCPMFLTQNDGTVISEDKALKFPVFTFASGATNSMRGAAFLSGVKEAIVVDIGGTSTDVGILLKGFPREASSEVRVGGIRTNFRMPDVLSIGLGGGSYVTKYLSANGQSRVKVGPQSAGYRIEDEALLFSKSDEEVNTRVVTATDIAVAAGIVGRKVGNKAYVRDLEVELVEKAMRRIRDMVSACIDQMRFNDRDMPLILVGGGSLLVDVNMTFDGIADIITPQYYDVANAVGAALSQISMNVDQVVDLEKTIESLEMNFEVGNLLKDENNERATDCVSGNNRKENLQKAREIAMLEMISKAKQDVVGAGAIPESVVLVDKDDVALTYIPGNATRMKIKVAGDLKVDDSNDNVVSDAVYNCAPKIGTQEHKQTVTNTGTILTEQGSTLDIKEPIIDASTGEWLISEYDIECLSIGAGILGCGGGGNPHVGRLIALKALKDGKKIRVVTPSRYLKFVDTENGLITSVAYMGAPLIYYEKLLSGTESTDALQCMQDLYSRGAYENGVLLSKEEVAIVEEKGVTFIDDYKKTPDDADFSKSSMDQKTVSAIMSAEIGGMNCIIPLVIGADLDIPILDCDGMGRAFPELQMFSPYMYGCKPYPSTLADDKGRRAVVLHADGPKKLENHFRNVVISMGCSGAVVLSHFNKDDVLNFTVQHSLSHAWRLGNTIIKARFENKSPVNAVVQSENGKLLFYGKIADVQRETTGGFNKGKLTLQGLDDFEGKVIAIDFQNEFLLARELRGKDETVLTCVPDLITLMDSDTAHPIQTEEIRYGMRVAVVAMRVSPIMSSETALKFVGPQAFGYPETVTYTPLGEFVDGGPVAPM